MAYTNVNDARKYLGISAAVDDDLLKDWIPAAQNQIDMRCRRTFEAPTDTTRYYRYGDLLQSDYALHRGSMSPWYGGSWADGDRSYIQGRSGILDLGVDVVSVTSLVNGNGTTITSDQFWLLPRNGVPKNAIQLKSTALWNLGIDQEIAVTGRFAYSLTAPADIVLAVHELIAYWYRSKDSQIFDVVQLPGGQMVIPKGWPATVQAILDAGNYVDPLGVI